jgi:hypothetical protein
MAEVRGDLVVKNSLRVEDNGRFLFGLQSPYLEVIDQKTSGSGGGTFTEGAFRTRDLTTTNFDDFADSITLTSTPGDGLAQIILHAGLYHIEASCPAFDVNTHVARLADVTDAVGDEAATVVLGTTEIAGAESVVDVNPTQTRSRISGRFQLSRQTTLEIQHRCETTGTTTGMGVDSSFYLTNNVYTIVQMWLLRDDTTT